MEKGGRTVKSPTKSSPARSISSVSSKNSPTKTQASPSNMTKPLPLPDFEIHHDNGVKSNINIKDADSGDEDTHNIHLEDHSIEIAAVSRKHTKSCSVFERLAETPIHHLSHHQSEVKSSPTKTSSSPTKKLSSSPIKTTSSSQTKKSSKIPTKSSLTKTTSSSPTKTTSSSSSSPTKKSSSSPTKSSPARSISSVSSKNSKNVGKNSPTNDNNGKKQASSNDNNGKKQASSNDNSNTIKPLPLPDLAAEFDDDIKANENENENENDDSDNQNDTDFSIYFDNIPIEDEKALNNSTLASVDVNTSIQMNLKNKKNNSDVVDKHTKSVFERLADTPIHHHHHHHDHDHLNPEAKSPDQKQFSDDQHHHHHHIHPTYDNHDNHVESVFERLSHTPIHHLTDREKLDIQQSNPVLQSKPSSLPTKRVTHSNLHVNSRIQGLTPEVKNIANSTVVHAVVLLTTVPSLVEVHQETALSSEEIDLNMNLIALGLLEDRIHTISKLKGHKGNKLIVAIPDRADQKNDMNNILEKMNLKKYWSILTIPNDVPSLKEKDTASGNLTELLKYTLKILGPSLKKGSISFTSSDCPTLHFNEITCAQSVASEDSNFYICPAQDGGYCLLTVPAATPAEIFDNIEWSNNDTCIQQILALRKVATESPQKRKQIVIIGKTHRDIDNIQDLKYLKEFLKNNKDKEFEKEFPKTINVLNRLVFK